MLINTKYLGETTITQEQILSFPQGPLGFESHHEFVLLSIPDNNHFKFLQDINNTCISFLLINPWDFFRNYEINVPKEELAKIGIQSNENKPTVYNIVTLGKKFTESTGNLLAPIVLNIADKKGKQFVLNDTNYTTRHKLFTKELGE
jgi:flagellar assembly factor FliW